MNEPHDIDQLLMQRASPRAPHDLADRIVYRAVRTPQTVRSTGRTTGMGTFGGFINEFLSSLMIPRPALAFGLCLMIGMFSGWASTQNADAEDDATQAIDMVVIEEEWL